MLKWRHHAEAFPGSREYWESRYAAGGNSGVGSYGRLAQFKSEVLNAFVEAHHVQSVIEFGCGDGSQLRLARYPAYSGFDVSRTAISSCNKIFKSDPHKAFRLMAEYSGETADLVLSLDVIYHLVEDKVFEDYMQILFKASNRYVIIYATDFDSSQDHRARHIRHRKFTNWIKDNLADWELAERLPNRYPFRDNCLEGSLAEFFVYEQTQRRGEAGRLQRQISSAVVPFARERNTKA